MAVGINFAMAKKQEGPKGTTKLRAATMKAPVVGLEEPQAGTPETALAEVRPGGGLREVAPSESLGGRAGLFIEQPLLPPAPFQSSHLRMASYGQEPAQQAPVLDPAQLLRIRGIR